MKNYKYFSYKEPQFLNRNKQWLHKRRHLIYFFLFFLWTASLFLLRYSYSDKLDYRISLFLFTFNIWLTLIVIFLVKPKFSRSISLTTSYKLYYFELTEMFIYKIFYSMDKSKLSFTKIEFLEKDKIDKINVQDKENYFWIKISDKNNFTVFFGSHLKQENKSILLINGKTIELNNYLNLKKVIVQTKRKLENSIFESYLDEIIINKIHLVFTEISTLIIERSYNYE
ncbi:hypothetical protein [Mesomycoplasma lagogenitalium]|uniref:DUF3137 domain-containing protein n=1 Tax=Mesomycoplasma lagogenitalium TaxID=171286 RepID=A0ABY8LTW1_9BACT|nr:hypothetical protein [Mesomycoplasma lagogenitalium]WGI36674.1 hypothetical protein QEG99_00090 [Mesomycoplasma lagogenitalium]